MLNSLMHRSLVVLAALTLVSTLFAQVPKVGKAYEDDSRFGFSVKMPRDWEFVPPQPKEPHLLGKYTPPNEKYIQVGPAERYPVNAWLLKFDRRPKPEVAKKPETDDDEDSETIEIGFATVEDFPTWFDTYLSQETDGWSFQWRIESQKDIVQNGLNGKEYVLTGKHREGANPEVRAFAAIFTLEPELEIGVLFNGPGKDKKWFEWEKVFRSMADSFKPVKLQKAALRPAASKSASGKKVDPDVGSGSVRDKKRQELNDEIQRLPGWKLYETENYFVISSNEDEQFNKEVLKRLEAIRAVYVVDYPPERARRKVDEPKLAKEGEGAGGEAGSDQEPKKPEEEGSVSRRADPMELSRTSVVRVCKDQSQYSSYGGPGGSAGYWSPGAQELVVYDDKAGGGRGDTWSVINHEAFHQYIFYFYGSISPHSWYNEGTGDYYAGCQFIANKFKLEPFQWRVGTIKEMIRNGSAAERQTDKNTGYVPLKELVRWTQGQYYGNNDYGIGGGQCYAQGWSLIYFLRAGKGKAAGWNPAWNFVLDVYLETLAESGDLDTAVDKAFEGVDWVELESAWKAFIG